MNYTIGYNSAGSHIFSSCSKFPSSGPVSHDFEVGAMNLAQDLPDHENFSPFKTSTCTQGPDSDDPLRVSTKQV